MKRDLSQDLQQIQTHLGNGRFTAGITLCREVLAYAPNDPNALYLLGLGAAQLGDDFTVKKFCDEVVAMGQIPWSLIRLQMTGMEDEINKITSAT